MMCKPAAIGTALGLALCAWGCGGATASGDADTGGSATTHHDATTSASTTTTESGAAQTSDGSPTTSLDPDSTGAGSDTGIAAPPTRIFVTLVSHNEDTQTGNNPSCLALFSALDERYEANRAAMLEIAGVVTDRGAAWDFQTDVEYLDIVEARESLDDNVVRTLATMAPDRIVVDAHAHEGPGKNYADVANRVEALSGARNGVIGGFTAVGCGANGPQADWEKFWLPISPQSLGGGPDLVATALTDGASAGHVCDPGLSGVWRPRAHEAFGEDDPRAPLLNIGVGLAGDGGLSGEIGALSDLLDDLHAGLLEPGRMYTSSPTIPHCEFDLADAGATAADIAAYIDEVNALGGDDVVWATYPEIIAIWHDEYDSQPSVWGGR